ncbi:MAG: right-handed parallel beta-helix repeat-containing protein [Lewinellaceae bacterium]|nr:right-handed parallel beta-helix repeat-containing protein [Lewinellaceae bacterium]
MMKRRYARFTPPLLNINFFNLLVGIFLLCPAGPVDGQAVFRGEVIDGSEIKLEPGFLKQVADDDRLLFSFDFRRLREFVKSQGEKAVFRLEIGRKYSWEITLYENPLKPGQKGPACKTYLGYEGKDPLNTVRLFIGDTYFDGFITSGNKLVEIRSKQALNRTMGNGTFLLMETEQTDCVPLTADNGPCVEGSGNAIFELGIVVDYDTYSAFGGNAAAINAISERVEARMDKIFAFYKHYVDICFDLRGPFVRTMPDDFSGEKDEILDAVRGYWKEKYGCISVDGLIMLNSGEGIPSEGYTKGSFCTGPCEDNYVMSPITSYVDSPLSPGTSVGDFDDKLTMVIAHELGHQLTSANHVDDGYTGCSADSIKCVNPPPGLNCFPLMCTGGGNITFTKNNLSDCTVDYIESRIAQNIDGCLGDLRSYELPCRDCSHSLDVNIDKTEVIFGCGGDSLISYSLEFCNHCKPDTFNILIEQSDEDIHEIENLTGQNITIEEALDKRLLKIDGVQLDSGQCYSASYDLRFTDTPTGGYGVTTTVSVDSIRSGEPETAYCPDTYPVYIYDATNTDLVNGLLSQSGLSLGSTSNEKIRVSGVFEIDESYTFNNSFFVMEYGAKIIVKDRFELNGCTIFACDSLWESITVEDGGWLVLINCTVSDAENAVRLLSGSGGEIYNTTFRNNYTGILMDLQPGQTASLFNCYGNTFLADGNLKAPRSDTKAFAGIWLRNASASVGVAGQAPNVFDGLYNGILALSSNLRVVNSTFQNLLSGTGFSPRPGAGHGIHAFGGSPLDFNLLYVSGDEGRPVLFENCTVGLRASGTNAYIFNTRMEAVDIGLRLQGCQDRSLRLWKNDIQARDIGIALLQNNPRFCSVFDNTIRLSSTDQFQDPAAIVVEDTPFGAAGYNGYVIRENTAEVSVTGAGIRMGPSRQVQVHDNTILLLDEESEKTGIRLSGTADAWLRCNTVMGPAGPTYSKDTYGFDATGASGTLITCNTTSNTRLGFRFEGMGDGVRFQGNNIYDHFNGLLIEETGAIGVQNHHGNLWCGLYADNGVGARHLGSQPLVFQSQFTVDPGFDGGSCNILPEWEANGNWFIPQTPGTGEETFICQSEEDVCSISTPNPSEDTGSGDDEHLLEKSLADETFKVSRYESALEWTGQRHLYTRLLAEEVSALELWEENFLDNEESSTVGAFSEIEANLQAAFTLDSTTQQTLAVLEISIQSKLDSLHWADYEYNNGIEVDSAGLQALRNQLVDSLENYQANGYDVMRTLTGNRSLALADLLTDNNGIAVDSVYETNEQLANTIFLETVALGIDTFTQLQANDLLALANQCPLSSGDAVFKARSLYSLIDPLVKYDDEALCAPAPEARAQQPNLKVSIAQSFQIFPNPTKDELTVTLREPLKKDTRFVVYDIRGELHLEKQLEAGEYIFYCNTSRLSTGIYYCKIESKESVYKTQKLIIIQ